MAHISTIEQNEDLSASISVNDVRKITRKYMVRYSSSGDPLDAVEASGIPAIGAAYSSGAWATTVVTTKTADIVEASINATVYLVTVEYSNETSDSGTTDTTGDTTTSRPGNRNEGDVVYSMDTSVNSIHINAIENSSNRTAVGFNTDRTLNIGARKTSSGDEEVQGVDKLVPSTRVTATFYLSEIDAFNKANGFTYQVGTTGSNFGPFSVESNGALLVGCTLGEPQLGTSYGGSEVFLYPVSVTAYIAGGISTPITLYDPKTGQQSPQSLVKNAWDYLWVYSEPVAVAGQITKNLPTSAYVDIIYPSGSWIV